MTKQTIRNTIGLFTISFFLVGGLSWYLTRESIDTEALAPTATGDTIIDLMVVYNNAADQLYNNDALTRINHLVDVSNQIYRDSGVNLTIRLVHTQKINYETAYDTETAIKHVTQQTHPAFADIPALRTEHGADLVVLMRPNGDDGYCGLAWIGGSGTNGDFSHPQEKDYGFSHVSINCGTYVLAHELGHNMGLNHSRKQDGAGGTFDYALGHGVDNDFVTVMAYSSAFNASKRKVFSNPSLTCGTEACGVTRQNSNGADAAFALNQVIPQVAGYFAATSSAPTNFIRGAMDVDGNGTSDLVLQHSSGDWNLSTMEGARVMALHNLNLNNDPNWRAVGRDDYDGDGMSDILMRNSATGTWHMFLMSGNRVKLDGNLSLTENLSWQVAGTGDFDGDGKGDVLLRNGDRWYQYFLDGVSVGSTARPDLPGDASVDVASTADFNGDGKTDVLTRGVDGSWHLYHLNGGTIEAESAVSMKKSLDWQVVGAGDFDGNERDDLLLRYKNGSWLVYKFDGFQVETPDFIDVTEDLDWALASTGDFDADGDTDILVRSDASGSWRLYHLNQSHVQSSEEVALTADLNWQIPRG